MRPMCRILVATFALLALGNVSDARILGVFQGKIIKATKSGGKTYLFVQGRSGFVRKVDVAHATVEYDDDFPPAGRSQHPVDALTVATNIRVVAEQKKDNWLADEVLILPPTSAEQPKQAASLVRPRNR
jgi:hypothetical protein